MPSFCRTVDQSEFGDKNGRLEQAELPSDQGQLYRFLTSSGTSLATYNQCLAQGAPREETINSWLGISYGGVIGLILGMIRIKTRPSIGGDLMPLEFIHGARIVFWSIAGVFCGLVVADISREIGPFKE